MTGAAWVRPHECPLASEADRTTTKATAKFPTLLIWTPARIRGVPRLRSLSHRWRVAPS